jgi:hypothetical protein
MRFGDEEKLDKLYSFAINTARGSAAETLGDLLVYDADGSRTAVVVPILARLSADPVIAVRVFAAHVIHASMRYARPQALEAFSQLIETDDLLLAAPTVSRLVAYLGYEDNPIAKTVIERMLNSPVFLVREVGGGLAAVAAFRWSSGDLLDSILEGSDLAQRKGAAAACADGLSHAGNVSAARRALDVFFADREQDVRKSAASVAGVLRGERLRPFKDTLLTLIASPAFTDSLPQLLITLEHAPDRVDDLVLQCSRRLAEVDGARLGDIRFGAAGDAQHMGELLIRAYAQATTKSNRSEILDMLDQLLALGAYGISDLLREAER